MVEQAETYQWEATLKDDSVKMESKGDKFDLNWEKPGEVKLFKLKQAKGTKEYSVDLTTGEFNKDGSKEIPTGFSGKTSYGLRYFKRNIVRVDEKGPLGNRVMYFIGYEIDGKEKLLKIAPEIGMVDADIKYEAR